MYSLIIFPFFLPYLTNAEYVLLVVDLLRKLCTDERRYETWKWK